jgi:hypothetical protein
MFGIEFFPLIENLLDLLFGSFFMLCATPPSELRATQTEGGGPSLRIVPFLIFYVYLLAIYFTY